MPAQTAPVTRPTTVPFRESAFRLRLATEPPPGGAIARPRLVRPLLDGPQRLALVIAPAGYGKTQLVTEWESQDIRPFAWARLTPADDAPARLLATIAAAVAPRGARPPSVEGVAAALSVRRPGVLVLDDAHVLRSVGARAALSAVATRVPAGSRLVLIARREPALALGRARARDDVVELRGDQLAMTDDETAAALGAELGLSHRERRQVLELTEGWPAAIRLVGRIAREAGREALVSLRGDDEVLAGYLREEVFAALAPGDVDFLRRVSVLETLSGPACDAVALQRGSCARLRELAAAGALLLPLDRAHTTFRLHTMAAQALRAELRWADPGLELALHRRAGAWHASRGDHERAIGHAVVIGDADAVEALLAPRAARYVASGRAPLVEGWLGRLPEEDVLGRPALAFAAGAVSLIQGDRDGAERWTRAALDASGPVAAAALRAGVARGGIEEMARDAQIAYAAAPASGPARAFACLLLGASRCFAGEAEDGSALLGEGARAAGPDASLAGSLCRALQALAAIQTGEDEDAVAGAAAARALLGSGEAPAAALVHAISAAALAYVGAFEAARDDAALAERELAAMPGAPPWYAACVELATALAHLRLSDASAAQELLRHATRRMRDDPGAVLLRAWIDDGWARADDFAASAITTPTALTSAELRVLRFLPTHLALKEIAARLHVSVNTVKTHAHAVYRKLDATSRSEAVERARRIGLVDL